MLEEDVFPESLRPIKVKRKFVTERKIPPEKLISLSDLKDRMLPYIEPEINEVINREEFRQLISLLDSVFSFFL